MYKTFTSESVCAGHPDKLCDQISDAILDALLTQDPDSHAGVEAAVTEDRVILMGELQTKAQVDYEAIAKEQIRRLGYTNPVYGFDDRAEVEVYIGNQSPDIAVGVDPGGAGDQGMMFGYAVQESPELMPLPITLAHKLTRAIDTARESGDLSYLRPDGKAQVTVRYEGNKPIEVTHVTVAVPHEEKTTLARVRADVYERIVLPVLDEYGHSLLKENLVVNGTGVWHLPGPRSDAGLTGRKIVVDGYGGHARVGGGAFSGKDPTKVDRSGAYAARYIAKNIVAAGLADRCEVAMAYFIGGVEPVMKEIETFGTNTVPMAQIDEFVSGLLDTSVGGIIRKFDLKRPMYLATAAYGHFGRDEFPWEKIASGRSS